MARRRARKDDSLGSLILLLVFLTTYFGGNFLYNQFGIQQIWTGYGISFGVSLGIAIVLMIVMREVLQLPGSSTYRKKMKSLKIANVDTMSGQDFEKYVAMLLQHQGYKTKVTRSSGDLGVDVLAKKGDEKLAIQCKRYSKKVPRTAVSDVVAGMNHYKCNRAMVVTTNYYQPGANQLAKSNNVQLVDRDILSQWIYEFSHSEQISQKS